VTYGSTSIVLPLQLRTLLGRRILNLGPLFYVYMGMLAVFCTNAINIYAGINGIEAGQSIIIALSVIWNNFMQLTGESAENHLFSLFLMIPFVAVSIPLLYYNWYPSRVFVGDTFCYFAGMTFAVSGILGHCSKTVLLFFIPQLINFLYSLPQLFRVLPCPRHRLPRLNKETGLLNMSTVVFDHNQLTPFGKFIFSILKRFHLVSIFTPVIVEDRKVGEGLTLKAGKKPLALYEINNLTIINLALRILGPTHERRLTIVLLAFQIFCSVFAFAVRYQFVKLFFDD